MKPSFKCTLKPYIWKYIEIELIHFYSQVGQEFIGIAQILSVNNSLTVIQSSTDFLQTQMVFQRFQITYEMDRDLVEHRHTSAWSRL